MYTYTGTYINRYLITGLLIIFSDIYYLFSLFTLALSSSFSLTTLLTTYVGISMSLYTGGD